MLPNCSATNPISQSKRGRISTSWRSALGDLKMQMSLVSPLGVSPPNVTCESVALVPSLFTNRVQPKGHPRLNYLRYIQVLQCVGKITHDVGLLFRSARNPSVIETADVEATPTHMGTVVVFGGIETRSLKRRVE